MKKITIIELSTVLDISTITVRRRLDDWQIRQAILPKIKRPLTFRLQAVSDSLLRGGFIREPLPGAKRPKTGAHE